MSDEEEDETEDSTDGAGEGEEADEETGTERVVYVAGEDLGLASGGGIVTGSAAHVAGEGLGLVSGGGIVTGSAAHIAGAGLLSGGGIVTGSTDDVSGEGAAVPLLQRVREKLILIGTGMKEAMLINCVTENGFWGFLVLWMVSLLLSVIGLFRRKTRMQGAMCISFLFYIAILCVLMASARIGLPVVIEDYRVRVFMCYALPFTIAVPLHFLWTIAESIFLSGQKEKETWRGSLRRYGMIPISVFMLITLVEQNLIRQPANTIVIQANEVVDVLYQIMDDYDDFSWTLVSDVQEYAMCLNNGRHYEWTDLLTKLSNGTMTIKIPTKYVFFAIEKRPICYGEVITTGEDIPIQGEVSRAHAQEAIDLESVASQDQLYVQYRLQLMSKAYYWAKAYAEMFPEEMKVYYEDDNVIYYCLTQEPYYLNNLKIDYQYNSLSGETQESGQEG
jgi:hypothetical protein